MQCVFAINYYCTQGNFDIKKFDKFDKSVQFVKFKFVKLLLIKCLYILKVGLLFVVRVVQSCLTSYIVEGVPRGTEVIASDNVAVKRSLVAKAKRVVVATLFIICVARTPSHVSPVSPKYILEVFIKSNVSLT